jgi:Carboxypeptidase regulatory-like domain
MAPHDDRGPDTLVPPPRSIDRNATGRVVDPDAVLPGANIAVRHQATGEERTFRSDSEGNYQVAALPVGTYHVAIQAPRFQTQLLDSLTVEVGRTVVQDTQVERVPRAFSALDSKLQQIVIVPIDFFTTPRGKRQRPWGGRGFDTTTHPVWLHDGCRCASQPSQEGIPESKP